jgi:hypothetical protein
MKSKRKIYRNKKGCRKTKKGGFFNLFKSNSTVMPDECNPNQLSMIKGSDALHQKYQTCCPKTYFGSKNSSPYCTQLDLNFQASLKGENDSNEYQGFSPEETYNMKNDTTNNQVYPQLPKREMDVQIAATKPWYKFWGGKKTRKRRNKITRNRYKK